MKWLCKIGIHKYRLYIDIPEWFQPWKISEETNWNAWIDKCERCGKEKHKDDMPLG